MAGTLRFLRALPLLVVSPLMLMASMLGVALADLLFALFGRKHLPVNTRPSASTASVVIPNWNGCDLLKKYLPSVEKALEGNAENEIIVVDNGSSDGSLELLKREFPRVRVLELSRNLGFGWGSNAGFRAARNDIVVLLNSDMRVEADFLPPLLEGFQDERVFAVSCQIYFTDPNKVREETGLTQGWWEDGSLRVRHRADEGINDLYPCFYGGGGSCAFDRRKFLELGGFDPVLAPFYMEDTDLGYLAWKRGWKVFYQPRSVVYHEHRGTIGKRFREEQIQTVLKKNFILFVWKNIHEWRRLVSHFFFTYTGALFSVAFGDEPGRANLMGLFRAAVQLPAALKSRWRSHQLATVSDSEAFLRPLGGYFRDRFHDLPADPERLRVLFVSPYPICPPIHGGGVFMFQTLKELVRWCDVHVVALLDRPFEIWAHDAIREFCASFEYLMRMEQRTRFLGSIVPHAIREFQNDDLAWLIHRQIYTKQIDVLQLEYTQLGQYAGRYRHIPSIWFAHDIYFQSISRSFQYMHGIVRKTKARFEYLRALRYEMRTMPVCDRVQVCSRENKEYLVDFLPEISSRLDDNLRAGIDTSRYEFSPHGREPLTMLFLGSFRHEPNQLALNWFVERALPAILKRQPTARLIVVGSDPPPDYVYADFSASVELRGFVEDIREPLSRYAVFICPILNGSGLRVKLLEAFAAGIPCVSTRIGAEGLAREDGQSCLLADTPEEFAEKVLYLFEQREEAVALAARARQEVVENWDMAILTKRLAENYRAEVRNKRSAT